MILRLTINTLQLKLHPPRPKSGAFWAVWKPVAAPVPSPRIPFFARNKNSSHSVGHVRKCESCRPILPVRGLASARRVRAAGDCADVRGVKTDNPRRPRKLRNLAIIVLCRRL